MDVLSLPREGRRPVNAEATIAPAFPMSKHLRFPPAFLTGGKVNVPERRPFRRLYGRAHVFPMLWRVGPGRFDLVAGKTVGTKSVVIF